MFLTFDQSQNIRPQSGGALFDEAGITLRFLPRGEELQVLCHGKRAFSISLNSKSFYTQLPQAGDFAVEVGYGKVTKAGQSLRVSLGGEFDSLAADEDVNQLRMPKVDISTMLLYIEKPFSQERAVCAIQFMGQVPGREIPVDLDVPEALDRQSFRSICERVLGVPKAL